MKLLAQRDVDGAVAAMERADRAAAYPTVSLSGTANHAAERVIFALRLDDLESATEWGRRLSQYTNVVPLICRHVPARLLIAQGQKQAGAEELGPVYEYAAGARAHGCMIRVRICQALAAVTIEEAIPFLTEALEAGRRLGFVRSFVDEGRLLAPLLREGLSRNITPEYTTKLLGIINEEDRRDKDKESKGIVVPTTSEVLSRRELEVLRLVAEGLTNQEIAGKLTISLSTAKTHVYHVFEKLDAKDRMQAVARAKQLNLI